jgi:hypothetical protein
MARTTSPKRAQIPEIFVILSALLVIGATIYLSSGLIAGLFSTACKVRDANFVQSLRELLDERSTFGMRSDEKLSPPCDAITLCFVDAGALGDPAFSSSDRIINASVHSGVKTNVFLQTRDTTLPQGYDERIILRLPSDPPSLSSLCIPAVTRGFAFRTEGFNKYVKVSDMP